MKPTILSLCCGALLAVGISPVMSADQPIVAITEEDAGEDFAYQGEYTGEIGGPDGAVTIGTQVIAMSDGKFRAVGYHGGLPGEGWNGEKRIQADGELKDGAVTFQVKGMVGEIDGKGNLTVKNETGDVIGTLKKVTRKSKTLGQKPPKDAVVLFDGSSADNFKGGKLSEDGYLMQGITSKQKFGAFQLHMEFKLSFMPKARGQGRSNSGVYMQGRHEVQILDSFGLEGKHNECGGIYEVRQPDVNMCYPPLSWQTYDVDFTPAKYDADGKKTEDARMTVKHNGEVIHNNVVVPKATRAHPVKPGPEPGPLYIQNHGNPVRFKNIWVVEK